MTEDEIVRRFGDSDKRFKELFELLEGMSEQLADVQKNSKTTKEIVEAWMALKTGGKFLRWLGGLLAAATAVYVAAKAGLTGRIDL